MKKKETKEDAVEFIRNVIMDSQRNIVSFMEK